MSEKASFVSKRSIGSFTATVTIEELMTDELEVTQHPVQTGAAITDHAFVKPSSLSLKVAWDDGDMPLSDTYNKILKLQASREPFTVVTGKRSYKNMLMKSLGVTTDAVNENILSVTMSLQGIIMTKVETVAVSAPRSNQKHASKTEATGKAGKKSAEAQTDANKQPRKKSALATLAGK